MGHIYVEDIERLEEIKEQIKELVEEAEGIVQGAGGNIYNRAKSYWIPELLVALDKCHDYCASCMCTMENTISEMRKEQHDDSDEEMNEDDMLEVLCNTNDGSSEFDKSEIDSSALDRLIISGKAMILDEVDDTYVVALTDKYKDEISKANEDTCPGCGSKTGDGVNEECDDQEGCGFYKDQEQNTSTEKSSRLLGRFEIIQELRATEEHFVEFERSELNHFELQKLIDEGYVVIDDVDGDCFSLVLTQKGEKALIQE